MAAWPAVALVGSYEFLMRILRNAQMPATSASGTGLPSAPSDPDSLQKYAVQVFADDLAECRVPSVRAIRAQLHVGQLRARRVRAHLATLTSG